MSAIPIVVALEIEELSLKVAFIPEKCFLEVLALCRTDEPFDRFARDRHSELGTTLGVGDRHSEFAGDRYSELQFVVEVEGHTLGY